MIIVIAVPIIAVPISLIAPLMRPPVIPSVVLIPAAIPLGVQIAASFRSLPASFTVLANGVVKPGFCLLNTMLAFAAVIGIGMNPGHGSEHEYCRNRSERRCRFPHSQISL
jgi:hypothetical protein